MYCIISEKEDREWGRTTFEEIIARKFLNFDERYEFTDSRSSVYLSQDKYKQIHAWVHIKNLPKYKDKDKILRLPREKQHITYMRNMFKWSLTSHQKLRKPKHNGITSKWGKKKKTVKPVKISSKNEDNDIEEETGKGRGWRQ